jgi:hypothetical protein
MTRSGQSRSLHSVVSTPEALSTVREANACIQDFLRHAATPGSASTLPQVPAFQVLAQKVAHAGEVLRRLHVSQLDEPGRELIREYAQSLEGLQAALEELRPQLQMRRAALQTQWQKLQASLAWAASLRQTR